MPSHKFHIGESVMLRAAVSRNVPGGVYEVTKQLPHNGLEFEYRILSTLATLPPVADRARPRVGR